MAAATGSVDGGKPSPTFIEFVNGTFIPTWLPKYRPATSDRYMAIFRQGLLAEIGEIRLAELNAAHVHEYVRGVLERRIQPRAHVNLIRTVTRAAVDSGVIAEMPKLPSGGRQSRKLPAAPTEEEVDRLGYHATGWLRTAIRLASDAGLRSGEVRALEADDVDMEENVINVRHALSGEIVCTPKSDNERVVPMTVALRECLAEAMVGKSRHDRLVVNGAGNTPRRQEVYDRLRGLVKSLGVKVWSFHSLRHYFCTRLLRAGATVEDVRDLAGHGSIAVTARYLHSSRKDLKDAIGRLDSHEPPKEPPAPSDRGSAATPRRARRRRSTPTRSTRNTALPRNRK